MVVGISGFVAGTCGVATLAAAAEEPPAMGEPRIEAVRQTDIYYYTVRDYTPPIRIGEPVSSAREPAGTPEGLVESNFVKMLGGDYEGWLADFDEASRAELARRNAELGRDANYWRDRWARGTAGCDDFALTRKVESGNFVIIEVRSPRRDPDAEEFVLDVWLRPKKGGGWVLTNKIGSDPVAVHWRRPGASQDTVVREADVDTK